MPKSKLPPKKWTMSELKELKTLRLSGTPVKELAKRFGRTYAAIHRKCVLLKVVQHPYPNELKRKVKELHKQGNPDKVICLKLKLKKPTLEYIKRLYGLKANKPHYHMRGNSKRPWPTCFGCDVKSPIMVENGWTELTGWSSEVQHAAGATVTVTLCPDCKDRSFEKSKSV